jgi:DNA-binding transcriptional LysR family regulator
LRIGASVTGCEHILPEVLREFRQSYPKCVVRIEPGDHAHQLALLRTGQIDLAVMLEPAPAALAEITVATLFSDELRFLVAPDHPWAKLGRAPREKIETESLIFFSKTSQTFRLVAEYFIEQKIALSDSIEVKSMDAMKELAKVGHGVAVMATWLAREELDSGALISVPLGSRKLRRRWVVACRKGRRLALAEETFIGLCEALAESRGLTASE